MPEIFLGELLTDLDPPYIANRFPANLAIAVATNSDVSFDVIDVGGAGVDLDSLNVTFNGSPVITAGVLLPGFAGSITPTLDGYFVSINPDVDFLYNQVLTVSVNVSDANPFPNVMPTDSWTFSLVTELFVPYVVNQGPTGNLQPLDTHIVFDIKDDGPLTIDPSSIVIKVQGVSVYAAMAPLVGYLVVVTPIVNGYHFDLTAPVPWRRGVFTVVTVDADDTANVMPTASWSFVGTYVGLEKCNPGPLLPVEVRLRTALPYAALEQLRRRVLTVISRDEMLDHRIRGTLLTANYDDFRPVFRDVLAIPPAILLESVCGRRRLFELYHDLTPSIPTMHQAIAELRSLGLSQGYVDLIRARVDGVSPQQVVGAACAIVLFGALLQPTPES